MSYIYVLPIENYVKFGITKNPLARIGQHSTLSGEDDLQFYKLWKGSHDIKRLESVVKAYLHDFPQKTNERIYAHKEVITDAIVRSAAFCEIELFERSLDEATKEIRKHAAWTNADMQSASVEWSSDEKVKFVALSERWGVGESEVIRRSVLDAYDRCFSS